MSVQRREQECYYTKVLQDMPLVVIVLFDDYLLQVVQQHRGHLIVQERGGAGVSGPHRTGQG